MAETPNLGLYVTDINQASDAGMSVFKLLELLLGSGYVDKSNMEKIDEAISVIKDKLADYKSENVYITDHQKEGIENKQSEFNWTKNNQIEYFAKLLGGYEKGVLTVENTNITNDKSDILFTVSQGFSKLNNTTTSGISEIQLAKSLLCERIMLDIKNDNDSIVYLTVYITVNGVQTTIPMTVPAKASVQKSFYNSIVRDLDDNSTIKFQAQTDGLPLIINSGSKAQYDYIDIDKISNLGDNFSDIIDNVYNELRSDIDSNVASISDVSSRTTSLEENLYNPNLLINSNFKVSELVNQRGKTVYDNAIYGNKYIFDQFKIYGGAKGRIDLNGLYLKFIKEGSTSNFTLVQTIEEYKELAGKTLTFSVMLRGEVGDELLLFTHIDGVVMDRYSAYIKDTDFKLYSLTFTTPETITSFFKIAISSDAGKMGNFEIKYLKLEVGEIATKFVDDNPAVKLEKCQRYLQNATITPVPIIADSTIQINGVFTTNTKMRLNTVTAKLLNPLCLHDIASKTVQKLADTDSSINVNVDWGNIPLDTLIITPLTQGKFYIINTSGVAGNLLSTFTTMLLSAEI